MVVCKCRKATNLYCFVHKVPVCGECICSSEHQICVVRTYSEWVIDGDYDWPPKCSLCSELLQHGEMAVSRLGCLHTFHLSCLSKYLRDFPPHTAPAGYTCPVCSTPVWPPKYVKDHNVSLAMNLKDILVQSGLSKSLLGNDISASEPLPLPAIAKNQKDLIAERNSDQLSTTSLMPDSHKTGAGAHNSNINITKDSNSAIGDNNQDHTSLDMASLSKLASSTMVNPGAMTRKNSARVDKAGLDYPEYDGEDEDETARKYNRRGPIQKQALKYLLPFSPNALSTLPISAPSRKDDHNAYAEDIIEGRQRRRQRSSGLNTKKILLLAAIMSCMATMLLLYYRLLQGTRSEDLPDLSNNQGQR